MRNVALTLALLAGTAVAQTTTAPAAPTTQPETSVSPVVPSKADKKAAKKAFEAGGKLHEKKHYRQAFDLFTEATRLDPTNADYITARELTRQTLISDEINQGNAAMEGHKNIEAMAAFRAALELDPTNEYARQRLMDSMPPVPVTREPVNSFGSAEQIHLAPKPGTHNFHYRGNSRDLIEQVCRAFGVVAVFDESVSGRAIRMDMDNADFLTAISVASKLAKVFWTPLSANQALFAAEGDANRRALQRVALRTFYFPETATVQELTEITNSLRVLFDIRNVTQQPATNSITVRAPGEVLDVADRFLQTLGEGRPQVMLDIKAFSVSRSATRAIGLDIPNDFQAFNVPTEAQKLLGGQNIQSLINQLIANGGINQANSTALAALLAQGVNAQAGLLGLPFFTFGGGITLTAVTVPPASIKLNFNESNVRSLEHVTLRAGQGTPAIFKVGTRVPIINASFAPIFNSAQLAQVIGNGSFIPPVPSFNYEDIGVNLKATPQIHSDKDITLDFEVQIRALGDVSLNGVPVISNREFKGVIGAKNGETVVIAGLLTKSEQHSLSGVPLLSRIPLVGLAFSTDTKQQQDSEILLVITPQIVRRQRESSPMIMMPATAAR